MTEVDKTKIRTAVKCYLKLNGKATSKQLNEFIQSCDLKLQCRTNPTIIAMELKYCMTQPNNNFLKLETKKDKTNRNVYTLKR